MYLYIYWSFGSAGRVHIYGPWWQAAPLRPGLVDIEEVSEGYGCNVRFDPSKTLLRHRDLQWFSFGLSIITSPHTFFIYVHMYVLQHGECKNRTSSCNQKSHIRKQLTRPLRNVRSWYSHSCHESTTARSSLCMYVCMYACIFLQHYRIHMVIGKFKNYLGIHPTHNMHSQGRSFPNTLVFYFWRRKHWWLSCTCFYAASLHVWINSSVSVLADIPLMSRNFWKSVPILNQISDFWQGKIDWLIGVF